MSKMEKQRILNKLIFFVLWLVGILAAFLLGTGIGRIFIALTGL